MSDRGQDDPLAARHALHPPPPDVRLQAVQRVAHLGDPLLDDRLLGVAVLEPVRALARVLDRARLLERVDDDPDEDVEDEERGAWSAKIVQPTTPQMKTTSSASTDRLATPAMLRELDEEMARKTSWSVRSTPP